MIKRALLVVLIAMTCQIFQTNLAGAQTPENRPEKRIALVIGIGAYQTVPALANPVRDAKAIAEKLRALAFDVDELYDADARALSRGIREFGVKAHTADVALVYYAGHGVQVAHDNYLIPADAKLDRERDLLYEGVSLELLLGEVSQAGRLGIVLLDACRNNPFVDRISRALPAAARTAVSTGLARVDNVPRNTVVAMATRADEVAEDGNGANSPFAAALLANLSRPGLELSLFFRTIRDSVLAATAGRQEPYVFSSMGAEPFYFNPLPPKRPPVVEASRRVRMYTGPIGIARPEDPNGDPLTIYIQSVPRGIVRDGAQQMRPGDRITPETLAKLTYVPEPGMTGSAGLLSYRVEGLGGVVQSSVEIEVIDLAEAAAQMAEASLWERLSASDRIEDLDMFLRLYPNSRFVPAANQRRATLARTAEPPPARVAAADPAPERPIAPPPTAPAPPAGPNLALATPATPPPTSPPRGMAPQTAPQSASEPAPGTAPEPGFRDCPTCPTMLDLPGGSFVMGQGSRDPTALPAHKVSVRPLAMQSTPVTIHDWKTCEADHGCGPAPRMATTDDTAPLHNASWDDAQQYLAWLSKTTGRHYRLPTEAEWEFAARAGTVAKYTWGEQIGTGLANCSDCGGTQDPRAPLPPQRFHPNPFGLYGMAGGVAQWVQDCWMPTYAGAPADGSARETKDCPQHVLRGGSFKSMHDDITPVARNRYDASVRYYTNGFRVARDLDGPR